MDAKELFFERYAGFQDYVSFLLMELTDEQIRTAPDPAVNPIAWTLWHIARAEDLGVNRLAVDGKQVLDDGWTERMEVPLRDIGTGMAKDAVRDLSSRIVLAELLSYRTAVVARTNDVVAKLPDAAWDEKLTPEILKRVFLKEGGVPAQATWIVDPYTDQTKGWLLGHIALTHNYYHVGQAFVVRSLHGLPAPW